MAATNTVLKNSKIARRPVVVPKNADVKINRELIEATGSKGKLNLRNHVMVQLDVSDGKEGKLIQVKPKNGSKEARALAGTYRALIQNMVIGVTDGFEKTLQLVGVGYRAKLAGKTIDLTVGYSHPIKYSIPEGITVEIPVQTTIVIRGANKQQVGQVAADIRSYRPPENYKGKGIRYANEYIIIKETKK